MRSSRCVCTQLVRHVVVRFSLAVMLEEEAHGMAFSLSISTDTRKA